MSNPAPALRPLPRRVAATLRGFAAPTPPPRPERLAALARRVDAALCVTATLLDAPQRVALALERLGRYQGVDASGDMPCCLADGVDEAALARWAAAGADVLAEGMGWATDSAQNWVEVGA